MTQATVYEFLRRGNFEPNLERVRGLLKARRDAMLEALERHMPDGAQWSRPDGGYFIWLDLPEETGDLLARAEEAGVTFVQGHRLLRGRRRHEVAAARLQLRLARRDRRRRREARRAASRRAVAGVCALAARAGSRRRSRPRG